LRKLILFNLVTLDGFFAGPDGDISWHNVDEEFNEFAIQQLDTIGALLFGRVTYEVMASYWPTPIALEDDPVVAGKMNSLPKFVFSRTLEKVYWQNTRLVNENAPDEVSRLKEEPGKDLFIFGSADLASTFTQYGLIDEYRIMVNPVVLGQGAPLFPELNQSLHLKLLNARVFSSGNVLLYYQPDRSS